MPDKVPDTEWGTHQNLKWLIEIEKWAGVGGDSSPDSSSENEKIWINDERERQDKADQLVSLESKSKNEKIKINAHSATFFLSSNVVSYRLLRKDLYRHWTLWLFWGEKLSLLFSFCWEMEKVDKHDDHRLTTLFQKGDGRQAFHPLRDNMWILAKSP